MQGLYHLCGDDWNKGRSLIGIIVLRLLNFIPIKYKINILPLYSIKINSFFKTWMMDYNMIAMYGSRGIFLWRFAERVFAIKEEKWEECWNSSTFHSSTRQNLCIPSVPPRRNLSYVSWQEQEIKKRDYQDPRKQKTSLSLIN